MSRRSTSSAGAVSLFPFLAVLVCAMGALILLLLVTTRRIRQRTLADETPPPAVQVEQPAPAFTPYPEWPVPLASAAAVMPDPADEPLLPLLARDTPAEPVDPNLQLRARLAELEQEQADLAASIRTQQQKMTQLNASADADRQALANLNGESQVLAEEKQRLNNLYRRLRQQQQDTDERAETLRKKIQQSRTQLADADSKFAIVPYDGDSGTARRPIIVECTADKITFVSEGIAFSQSDLNGFIPRYNPLLYVAEALTRYWERRDRASTADEVGEPYLLLIVRPGGTETYYVALHLLAARKQPFGYELVTDDQEFVWPASEPEAVAIARAIVDRMLAERSEQMDVALRSGADLGSFGDGSGKFRLPEIEELRNPTREVTINGQRFSRDPGGFERGGSGGEPSGIDGYANRSSSASVAGRGAGEDTGAYPAAARPDLKNLQTDSGPSPGGVYTRQNSAVTQAERMPEWLREGTARLAPDAGGSKSQPISEVDPFADVDPMQSSRRDRSNRTGGSQDGQANSFDQAATKSGRPSPTEPQSGSGMLTFSRDGRKSEPTIDPQRPRWGLRSANGTIGYERELRMRVTPTEAQIGTDTKVVLSSTASPDELRRTMARAINHEVTSWGEPPRSFYWVPSIRYEITRDAAAQYQRLKRLSDSWELRSSVEYIK